MRTKNLLLGWGKDGKVFVTVQSNQREGVRPYQFGA